MSKEPTVLMILGGYGLNDNYGHNAVREGKTPIMDQLMNQCPFVKGGASGMAVGFSEGQTGNSEVGHLNMGTGRIVYQELTRTTKLIQGGDFFRIPEFITAVENCRKHDSALYMLGLVSGDGVHSHNTHIYGPLEPAKKNGLKKVYVRCFLDGRDTPPESGKGFVEQLEAKVKEIGIGGMTSVIRRYYAMDRDKRWNRVEQAYSILTKDEGSQAGSAAAGIQASYDGDKANEFVIPFVVTRDGKPVATTQDRDSAIFHNFRPDCAREIIRAFCGDNFDGFLRKKRLDLMHVCFTNYDETIQNKLIAFKKESITSTFGEFLAVHKKAQVRIAETKKYTHVTFLFNGGVEGSNGSEDRTLIPSPKEVATYDLKPEMSANGVRDKLVETIRPGRYDVIIINLTNPDMVGHTGVEDAAIKAIGTMDACVSRAVGAVKGVDGVMFIYANHGNVEQLVDYETGEPFTAHITNPVPLILVNMDPSYKLRKGGALCDIVPALIGLMGMEQPKEITGTSLLIR